MLAQHRHNYLPYWKDYLYGGSPKDKQCAECDGSFANPVHQQLAQAQLPHPYHEEPNGSNTRLFDSITERSETGE